MVTMLLGGLWHGAAWTFVAWGFFHGILITASHSLAQVKSLALFHQPRSRWINLFKWALTFYLVTLGWVLFRATSLGSAFDMLATMHGLGPALPQASSVASIFFGLTVTALMAVHLIDYFVLYRSGGLERRWWLLWPVLILVHTLCLLIGEPSDQFIYFQF